MAVQNKMLPVHPGEILDLEFFQPLGLTQYRLAKSINVSPRRINEIVKGTRSVTAKSGGLRILPLPHLEKKTRPFLFSPSHRGGSAPVWCLTSYNAFFRRPGQYRHDPIRLARIGEQRWWAKINRDTHHNPLRLVRMVDKIENFARSP